MSDPIVLVETVLDDTAIFPTFTGKYGKMVEHFLKEFPTAKLSIHNETNVPNNELIKREDGLCQININAYATINDLNENQELLKSLMEFYFNSLIKKLHITSFNPSCITDFLAFYQKVITMMRNKRIGSVKVIQQISPSDYQVYESIVNNLREWNNYSNYKGTTLSYHITHSGIIEFFIEGVLSCDSTKMSQLSITPLVTTV